MFYTNLKTVYSFPSNNNDSHTVLKYQCVSVPDKNYANKILQPSLCHSLMTNTSCELGHMISMSTQVTNCTIRVPKSLMNSRRVLVFVSALLISILVMVTISQHVSYCCCLFLVEWSLVRSIICKQIDPQSFSLCSPCYMTCVHPCTV